MGTNLDFMVGIGKETTYGDPTLPTRFFETEGQMDETRTRVTGSGLRPAVATDRSNRVTLSKVEVNGQFELDVTTSDFEFLLEAALGEPHDVEENLFNLEQDGYFFRPTTTDPLPSYTITEVLPYFDGTTGGTVSSSPNVRRFVGCQVQSLAFTFNQGEVVRATVTWVGKQLINGGPVPAASYPANDELLDFVSAKVHFGSGILTPAITLDYPEAEFPFAGDAVVSAFSLTIANNLDQGGYGITGGFVQTASRKRSAKLGKREITGSFTVEYAAPEFVNWFTNDERHAVTIHSRQGLTWAGLALSMPCVIVDGEIPKTNQGSPINLTMPFKALDDGESGYALEILYATP